MKNHGLLWFLCLLVCLSLSCNLNVPFVDKVINQLVYQQVKIEGVAISPKSGSGNFSATVKLSQHDTGDTVQCYVPYATDTSSKVVVLPATDITASDGLRKIDFTFTFTHSGSYVLACTALESDSQNSADFTVTSGTQSQEPSTGQPSNGPFTITGTGTWTVSYTDPVAICSAKAKAVTLSVVTDDAARLDVGTPVWSSWTPCTLMENTYNGFRIDPGTVNRTDETVNFKTCVDGAYAAQGTLSYADGKLKGEVTCFDTSTGMITALKVTMP